VKGSYVAKKKSASKGDRSDPKQNKSQAIRNVMEKMPTAKASELVMAVKAEYGHKVPITLVYAIKAKGNMAKSRKRRKKAGKAPTAANPMKSAASWVEAINICRELLKVTGSVENATSLLRAVGG
jgi:hypothetical protein